MAVSALLGRKGLFMLPARCRSVLLQTLQEGSRAPYKSTSSLRVVSTSTKRPACPRTNSNLAGVSLAVPRPLKNGVAITARQSSSVIPMQEDPKPVLEPYSPPTTGLLSILPSSWVPYAELMRLDKPTGAYYLYFPCLFSTLLAAPVAVPMASPLSVLGTSILFFSGAIIMRGAGCAINDLWDRNLDPHVARTRLRPIARKAITPFNALTFTGFNLLAGLAVLLQFPFQCFYYAVPSLLLVTVYPLAKRVTYYPQFVLGLTFSWGAIMGFPALGIDLIHHSAALASAGFLYASNIAWTVLYDMIYAHMDIKDDAKAGIKSIALKHDAETKQVLSAMAVLQIGLLAAAGASVGAGPVFFIGSCGGGALTLAYMIKRVNLKSVRDCWWWFVNGCLLTGGVISAGLAGDYAVKYLLAEEEDTEKQALSEKA
ncbi:UbiA prenyltransferase family-domain-containing protein [Xylogone sp. PMI_703]|nr:UbiA prenyltransferase family-domain-containing protein [Xylogone sp. PMI_703]